MNPRINLYTTICLTTVLVLLLALWVRLGPIPLTDASVERTNFTFCEAMKEKSINSIFNSFDKDKFGKPAIETSDGQKHTPYGILRHVEKMKPGDSIVKHSGSFDYVLYRKDSRDSIVLKAVEGIPCQ